jgi:phosphoglycolate phosphatase
MFEVVFFDLDGVIVDSEAAIAGCLHRVFAEVGMIDVRPEAIRAIIGPPLGDGVRSILAADGRDPALADGCIARYRELYRYASLTDTTLARGIAPMLAALQGKVTLAIATSKPRVFAEPILSVLGVKDAFAVVAAPEPDARGETKTDTLRRAVADTTARMGHPVVLSRTMMVGDRRYDIEAARALGMTAAGVTWGYGSRAELEAAGADAIVDDPGELTRLVLETSHAA